MIRIARFDLRRIDVDWVKSDTIVAWMGYVLARNLETSRIIPLRKSFFPLVKKSSIQ